jgi:hypothetical protein
VFLANLSVDPAGVDEADLDAAAVQTGPDMHVWYRNCVLHVLQIAVPLPAGASHERAI